MRAEPFAPDDVVLNDFLGGRARIWQPRDGYRAGIDPVLLAASVPARAGQSVLELGCGGAPALVCLGTRVRGLDLNGLEIQPGYADLARRNLAQAGLTGAIHEGSVADLPAELRVRSFEHVLANPPYFRPGQRTSASDPAREIALAGETPLAAWIDAAARRLAPGGHLSLICAAERLPDLLREVSERLGSPEMLPLQPRVGRAPRLVLLRARKGGRAPFRFHPPVLLHRGAGHEADGDDYAGPISDVLRGTAPLDFPE